MTELEKENNLLLFTDNNGQVSVNVRFVDEDVWLTQEQLSQIYDTTQQNISQHVKGIYADEELEDTATHKKFLLVRQEGSRKVKREIDHSQLFCSIFALHRICVCYHYSFDYHNMEIS